MTTIKERLRHNASSKNHDHVKETDFQLKKTYTKQPLTTPATHTQTTVSVYVT